MEGSTIQDHKYSYLHKVEQFVGAQKHTLNKHNNKTKINATETRNTLVMSYVYEFIYLANSRCRSFIALAH